MEDKHRSVLLNCFAVVVDFTALFNNDVRPRLTWNTAGIYQSFSQGSMDKADNGGAMPCLEAAEEGFRVVGSTVD